MKPIGLLFLVTALVSADPVYNVVSLGDLGGSSSQALAINNSGTVAGWANTAAGAQQAFTSSGGAWQNLSTPGAEDTYAFGINSSGAVAGASYINGTSHGSVWTAAGVTDLGANTYATGINDAGQVVGSNGQAFLYADGNFQDLGLLTGGDWSAAYGINNASTVVGYGTLASGLCRGFIWTPTSGMTALGTLGGMNSYAMAVNNQGAVVGNASLADGYQNAFLDVGGLMTGLGTLAGGSSYAYSINDSGEVVGYSWSPDDPNPRAFLYIGGRMLDLNSLIPTNSGWVLEEAYGINANGDIVGSGLYNGQLSAFVLHDPPAATPEPASLPVLAAALALLIFATHLRKLRAR